MSMTELLAADQDAALRGQVRELIASTFLMDIEEVSDDLSQDNCGRWTSLYHMMLLVVLEERFGAHFTMDEMASMTSLSRIVSILKSHGVSI
jgi:acyl carrier protein